MALRARTLWIGMLLCACNADAPAPPVARSSEQPAAAPAAESLAFCARPGADKVRDVFCPPAQPDIHSLHDLQVALGIQPDQQGYQGRKPGEPVFAKDNFHANFAVALSHSTSLSGHHVSAINPRVFFLTQEAIVAFTRGVQRVELAAAARDKPGFNFYLLELEQECNAADGGCKPGDLYTPSIERDWQRVIVRDDEALKNTTLDCRQCHARGRSQPQLLMRELEKPWTHFFLPLPDPPPTILEPGVSGVELTRDYLAAKGDEAYGGAPEGVMRSCPAVVLEGLSGADQPLVFDSETILRERWPDGLKSTNTDPLPSPTWESAYESFKRGERLALPYLEPRVADLDKQAALSDAYARYRNGELSAQELPDLSDIFPDDPQLRARIGLQTEHDAEPDAALIQACAECHNDVLDQSLSRARFNIDLSRLPPSELALAVARIQLPPDNPLVMPPREARQLEAGTRTKLLEFLQDHEATARVNDKLQRAAARGGIAQRD